MTLSRYTLDDSVLLCSGCGEAMEAQDQGLHFLGKSGGEIEVAIQCPGCKNEVGYGYMNMPHHPGADKIRDVIHEIDNVMSDENLAHVQDELDEIAYDLEHY